MKAALLALPLLLCVIATPLSVAIFSPSWYSYNCQFHSRCEHFGISGVEQRAQELGRFFLYQGSLSARWSAKEQQHLAEVRQIYRQLFIALIVSLLWVGYAAWRWPEALQGAARADLALLGLCALVLPFFASFWRDIFHPLLFDNNLWKNNPNDTSWYLMPRVFFKHSLLLILLSSTPVLLLIGYHQAAKKLLFKAYSAIR